MKYLCTLIIFAAALISCSEETASNSDSSTTNSTPPSTAKVITEGSPEEFAEKLANFVIDSNYTGIAGLVIERQEMIDLIKNSSVMREGKILAIEDVDTQIGMMKMDMSNGLVDIRNRGREAGIMWDHCNYKSCSYEVNNPTGYEMMQMKIVLECNSIEHTITVTDVPQTPAGWKLGGKILFGDVQSGGVK